MKIVAVLLLLGLSQVALGLQRIDQATHVVAAESVISPGQQISGLEALTSALGLDPATWSLVVENTRFVSDDVTLQRLRLVYGGLKVRSFTLQAALDGNSHYTGHVTGYIPKISGLDTTAGCCVKKREVKDALAQLVNDQNTRINQGDITGDDLKGFDFERQIHVDLTTGTAVVALYAQALVDLVNYVRNPKALFDTSLNLIRGRVGVRNVHPQYCPAVKGGNAKFPGLYYGPISGQVCLHTKVKGDTCYLRSRHVEIRDANGMLDRSKADIVAFKCSEGLHDARHGGSSPNADAFYYSQIFFDLLENWGKLTYPDSPVTIYTHYGNWTNSFWDGNSATFGDGDAVNTFPYAVKEVIGHELGHAVTELNGNVVFDSESAAVDESFADICGKAVTVFAEGSLDWKFADNLIVSARDALRYFNNPSQDGRTVDHVDKFETVQGSHPALGVGVFDKSFYLVVEAGVPFRFAFEAFVMANQIYWHEETGFFDGACGVTRAARDLGLDTAVFQRAFLEVGIDLAFCSL